MRILSVFFLLGSINLLSAQTPLRLHGSTTVQAALESKHPELEKLIGRKIEFSPSGTNVGLVSLAAGRADMAMLATPFEEIAGKLNEKSPGLIEVSQYHVAAIGRAKIAFIINPRNPVRKLSAAEIVNLLTGKTKNWKDVGGHDASVVVVALANAGSTIQTTFLGGVPIASQARLVPNAAQIPSVVAQDVNAIGIISTAHLKGPTSLVQTDAEVFVPLFLVTKGEPDGAEKALIDAVRSLLAQNH